MEICGEKLPGKGESEGRGSLSGQCLSGSCGWSRAVSGGEKVRLGAPAPPRWGHPGGAQGWVPDIGRPELTGTAESPREGAERQRARMTTVNMSDECLCFSILTECLSESPHRLIWGLNLRLVNARPRPVVLPGPHSLPVGRCWSRRALFIPWGDLQYIGCWPGVCRPGDEALVRDGAHQRPARPLSSQGECALLWNPAQQWPGERQAGKAV